MAEEKAKHAGGRPTKFEPWMIRVGAVISALGGINKDFAQAFDIQERTVDAWLAEDTEFSRVIKSAKEDADAQVVKALFKRATGYDHNDQHIPAHPTSQIFWLKNRQRELWRDKVEHEHAGTVNLNHQADPAQVANQLVTLGTQYPTLNPVIRELAQSILDRLPALG